MPLTYRATIHPRERVLAMGSPGVGKSHAILTVARRCPDAKMYVIDNDFAYDRLLATDFVDLKNVDIVPVVEWDEYIPTVREFNGKMGRDDWLVIDSMTPTWDAVQGWFSEQVFGRDIDEYFLEVRKKKAESKDGKKTLGALDGWMDWPVINKSYYKLYAELMKCPGHVYLTAEVQSISDDDDKQVKGTFGPYGVKPRGQKRLGHVVQTVLLMSKSRVGEYSLTTVKDRGRVEMEGRRVEDWSKDYLVGVAGWRPVKVD